MGVEGPPPDIREIELFEIEPRDAAFGQELAAHLSRRLPLVCRLTTAPAEFLVPELDGRDQVDADRLLAVVESLPRPPACVRVALLHRDMGHLIFTHFFGRARHGGHAVLVSTARLDPGFYGLPPDRALTIQRATNEILHELGHTSGLGHCEDWRCVMRFAAKVEDLELRGDDYCRRCAAGLSPHLARGS